MLILYQNADDQAAIIASRDSFITILKAQFGDDIPFLDGADPWPGVVAGNLLLERNGDGAGNPGAPHHAC